MGAPISRHRRRVHRAHRHPARPRCATNSRPPRTRRLHFHRSLPVPAGHSVLTRTDATVEALSRYVLDAALDSRPRPAARPARRAGVMRTRGVNKVTTLLMVRYRLEITIPGSRTTVTQVAEEAKFLAFTATGDDPDLAAAGRGRRAADR